MSVEDRYYTQKEYSKLSNAMKEGLRLKRKKRGHQPGDGSKKTSSKRQKTAGGKEGKAQVTLSKRDIMAIAKQVRFMDGGDEDESASEHSEEKETPKPPTNRNNKALQRKKP